MMNTKHVIAVFMADKERSEEFARGLASDSMETIITQSSEEICQVLNYQRVDLVVIDQELRGFFKGLEILERIYDDLLRPATILLADRSEMVQQRAGRLNLERILPADSAVEAVRLVAQQLLTAGRYAAAPISLKARRLVQDCGDLRPLPQILIKLSSYLDMETASLQDLARDVSVDPRVTADLLTTTNSTCMGLRRKFTQVSDAVNFLGLRRTVSLVLSAAIARTQHSLSKNLSNEVRNWYNRRSVLIAGTAATFAQRLENVSPENAHLLGLFQDLGILILAAAHGNKFSQLVERVRTSGQLRLELSEQQTFGITHAEVSAALLQKWGLPSSLISLVVAHHHSEADIGGMSQVDQRFLHVMQIGEAVANLADLCHVHRRQVLNRLLARYGEDKAPQCRAALEESVAKAVEASQLFSIPIPEDAELEALLQRLTSDGSLDETSPDASAPAELPSDDKTADSPSTADKSILVIENDEVVIQLVTGILSTAGFEVLTCPDSQRAEALAPRARAVLCDFHLRERDGAQLVAGLRQSGFRKPIIMMSGERKRSVVDQCIKAGITDFLPKPFSSEALLQKVNKHLVAEHA